MGPIATVFRREFAGYFATPVAFIFIIIFLALAGSFTFYLGYFIERGNADLQTFFLFHPWLYLLLIPAVSMRLWAEERKQGTIELFLTLPISITQAVVGKFLAAWAFVGLALALTFPMWITVNVLGEPDNGVIAAGYLGSLLMAGSYLAIGSCLSAVTKNQVIAFVLTITVSFLFTAGGSGVVVGLVQGWAPQAVVSAVQSLSFLNHFQNIAKGVIDLRDAVFFVALIAAWLAANVLVVDLKKAD
ncbi:MAG: ABC transporter permease subunit [Alphaproteobacteria bacterium]|nr:ABC transporter permease subunit [Alphaproteobacteria bacterium]MCB9931130.1 ABC transporter permease subunit [Alphaproteobacteria bacterium]